MINQTFDAVGWPESLDFLEFENLVNLNRLKINYKNLLSACGGLADSHISGHAVASSV